MDLLGRFKACCGGENNRWILKTKSRPDKECRQFPNNKNMPLSRIFVRLIRALNNDQGVLAVLNGTIVDNFLPREALVSFRYYVYDLCLEVDN
jgi:hypothetical protein